ncbi:hypothetical protein [Tiger frog virus]|uniref:Uncharacterized protein n=1 Tax=Rana tigrina ranavirus TaxID=160691 RepID=Q2WER8_RTRV|nr:hypothetical protein [Tiger frog virus]
MAVKTFHRFKTFYILMGLSLFGVHQAPLGGVLKQVVSGVRVG